MKPLAVRLAWAWLGFAALGLAYAIVVVVNLFVFGSPGEVPTDLSRLTPAFAALVLWTLPLALGAGGVLRGARWGWAVLLAHVCLGFLLWVSFLRLLGPLALAAIRNHYSQGPYWGGYPGLPLQALFCLSMALFSLVTVWALLRDWPEGS